MLQQNALESVTAVCLRVVIVLPLRLIHGPGEILVGWSENMFDCFQFFQSDFMCEISTMIFHYNLTAVGLQRKA